MKNNNKPVSRKDEIVVQEVDGELLIYDLRSHKAFCLNKTSALIWDACDGSRDVPNLSRFLSKELNAPVNDDLIWLALCQLGKEDLIHGAPERNSRFAGISRREVIKKIGLGSAITLPVVAGLVAPPAVLAQTACGTFCHCNDQAIYPAGVACPTTGGSGGLPCPSTPAGCAVCRSTGGGINTPGDCFTS